MRLFILTADPTEPSQVALPNLNFVVEMTDVHWVYMHTDIPEAPSITSAVKEIGKYKYIQIVR